MPPMLFQPMWRHQLTPPMLLFYAFFRQYVPISRGIQSFMYIGETLTNQNKYKFVILTSTLNRNQLFIPIVDDTELRLQSSLTNHGAVLHKLECGATGIVAEWAFSPDSAPSPVAVRSSSQYKVVSIFLLAFTFQEHLHKQILVGSNLTISVQFQQCLNSQAGCRARQGGLRFARPAGQRQVW